MISLNFIYVDILIKIYYEYVQGGIIFPPFRVPAMVWLLQIVA